MARIGRGHAVGIQQKGERFVQRETVLGGIIIERHGGKGGYGKGGVPWSVEK